MCTRQRFKHSVLISLMLLVACTAAPALARPACDAGEAAQPSAANNREATDAGLILTPLVWSVLAPVGPVEGTDGVFTSPMNFRSQT